MPRACSGTDTSCYPFFSPKTSLILGVDIFLFDRAYTCRISAHTGGGPLGSRDHVGDSSVDSVVSQQFGFKKYSTQTRTTCRQTRTKQQHCEHLRIRQIQLREIGPLSGLSPLATPALLVAIGTDSASLLDVSTSWSDAFLRLLENREMRKKKKYVNGRNDSRLRTFDAVKYVIMTHSLSCLYLDYYFWIILDY